MTAGEVIAQLMTWGELAALLGFAIPLLLPLLALAVYADKLKLEIIAQNGCTFEGINDLGVGPALYVFIAALLANTTMAAIFSDGSLHGKELRGLVSGVCSAACVCSFLVRKCREKSARWKVRNRYNSEVEITDVVDLDLDGADVLQHDYHALVEEE